VRFDVVTIFPEALRSPLEVGLLGRALESGLVEVRIHDLRDWAPGPHRKVDDEPFGGGAGMVMAPGPIVDAVESLLEPDGPDGPGEPGERDERRERGGRVLLLTAAGRPLDDRLVRALAGARQVVLVCGRYEGIDDRVGAVLGADEVSIGDFVLLGGEVAAMAVIEAVARHVPGVLGNASSLEEESFGSSLLEYPQFTRPAEFRGIEVPPVLVSGDHGRVARWRREQALRRTAERRPDLLDRADLTPEERRMVEEWRSSRSGPSGR
jgi:tRNA (guanine37-N1)-methyltransferase